MPSLPTTKVNYWYYLAAAPCLRGSSRALRHEMRVCSMSHKVSADFVTYLLRFLLHTCVIIALFYLQFLWYYRKNATFEHFRLQLVPDLAMVAISSVFSLHLFHSISLSVSPCLIFSFQQPFSKQTSNALWHLYFGVVSVYMSVFVVLELVFDIQLAQRHLCENGTSVFDCDLLQVGDLLWTVVFPFVTLSLYTFSWISYLSCSQSARRRLEVACKPQRHSTFVRDGHYSLSANAAVTEMDIGRRGMGETLLANGSLEEDSFEQMDDDSGDSDWRKESMDVMRMDSDATDTAVAFRKLGSEPKTHTRRKTTLPIGSDLIDEQLISAQWKLQTNRAFERMKQITDRKLCFDPMNDSFWRLDVVAFVTLLPLTSLIWFWFYAIKRGAIERHFDKIFFLYTMALSFGKSVLKLLARRIDERKAMFALRYKTYASTVFHKMSVELLVEYLFTYLYWNWWRNNVAFNTPPLNDFLNGLCFHLLTETFQTNLRFTRFYYDHSLRIQQWVIGKLETDGSSAICASLRTAVIQLLRDDSTVEEWYQRVSVDVIIRFVISTWSGVEQMIWLSIIGQQSHKKVYGNDDNNQMAMFYILILVFCETLYYVAVVAVNFLRYEYDTVAPFVKYLLQFDDSQLFYAATLHCCTCIICFALCKDAL